MKLNIVITITDSTDCVERVREAALVLLGGNCTFVEDDLILLCALARAAIEARLAHGVVHESIAQKAEMLSVARVVSKLAEWCAE